MTTLADYMDLRAEVVRLLKTPDVVDNLDNHTRAGERYISQRLRHRKQIVTAPVTFTAGRAPLPADFIEMLNVYGPGGWIYVQAPLESVEQAPAGGGYFAVDDSDIIIPGIEGAKDIQYYAALPTITSSLTGTNWCLLNYPELYTYATMYCAAPGYVDADAMSAIEVLRDRYLREARMDNERAQYSMARVRVGGVIA